LVPNAFNGRLIMRIELDDIAHRCDLVDVETVELEAIWLPRFSRKRKIMKFSEVRVVGLYWDPGHKGFEGKS
jgi:hypothetical protein